MKRLPVALVVLSWALVPSFGWADEGLGRLFYTPEQRARMDVARQHERNIRIDDEESVPQSASILLNGVIIRSDGKSTLWINNRLQNEPSPSATVGKGGEVRVVAPDAKRSVRLKVGQSIDMTSGEVEEVYRRRPPVPSPEKTAASAVAPDTAGLPGRKEDTPANVQDEASLSP